MVPRNRPAKRCSGREPPFPSRAKSNAIGGSLPPPTCALSPGVMNFRELQCYMCDRQATSHEHVPPKCIFPERKDTDGQDLRAQLITVPSCDIHNSKKSKDDESLMV